MAHEVLFSMVRPGFGPPIVLLHGLGSDNRMFKDWFPYFPGRHVITVDLRGHGRKDSRSLGPIDDFCQLAEDVHRTVVAQGVEVFDLVGYSLGGLVAQQVAIDHPQRVRRLALVSTYPFYPRDLRSRLILRTSRLIIGTLGLRRIASFLASWYDWPDEQRQAYAEEVADNDHRQVVRILRAIARLDLRQQLGEITAPTLVIGGEEDRLVTLAHVRPLAENIPGACLVLIPGAGHDLLTTNLREVVEKIACFLCLSKP